MQNKISTGIFNAVITAYAVITLDELGLLDRLRAEQEVGLTQFAEQHQLQKTPLTVLIAALASSGIITFKDDIIQPDVSFEDIYTNKGYFSWLLRGYGNMLGNMPGLLKSSCLTTECINRDGGAIASAGKDYGQQFVDRYINKCIEQLEPKCIVDLGCGSAQRLIGLLQEHPSMKGIGVDSNKAALTIAGNELEKAGLTDRLTLQLADVKALPDNPFMAKADLLLSCFMGHDLFPEDNCYQIFKGFKNVFPNAKNFLLCDTYKSDAHDYKFPIFSLGFELTHAFMGQSLPKDDNWRNLFHRLGWSILEKIDIDIPDSSIYKLDLT